MKNVSIFGAVFSEAKNADILNFSWIQYFCNFSFLIKLHIWVCYCWNYRSSNLKVELKADFSMQIGMYSRKNWYDMILNKIWFWAVTFGKYLVVRWRRSEVFNVTFEINRHLFLVFLLLTLNIVFFFLFFFWLSTL